MNNIYIIRDELTHEIYGAYLTNNLNECSKIYNKVNNIDKFEAIAQKKGLIKLCDWELN